LGARSFSRSHQFLDDSPTGTPTDLGAVVITITDDDALAGTFNPSIRVDNVAPNLENLAITSAIDENGIVTLTGEIADPGTLDTFTLDLSWGDPVSPSNVQSFTFAASASGRQSFSFTHRYLDDNPTATSQDAYTIGLKLTDDDTGVAVASLQTRGGQWWR
jgi:large repetitive protein